MADFLHLSALAFLRVLPFVHKSKRQPHKTKRISYTPARKAIRRRAELQCFTVNIFLKKGRMALFFIDFGSRNSEEKGLAFLFMNLPSSNRDERYMDCHGGTRSGDLRVADVIVAG
ncbi:Uncharacterized protein APZ42_011318 [Daphnia magna]|uniref:Uncharacterized protein n=1 Tax=Daphnia magna TaxID=35525 RepID=A0A162SKF4_9CRUS|nr:Uncharacterized protein APZ42_011318 [Daphnia magna]